jgi:hypothetical protein
MKGLGKDLKGHVDSINLYSCKVALPPGRKAIQQLANAAGAVVKATVFKVAPSSGKGMRPQDTIRPETN